MILRSRFILPCVLLIGVSATLFLRAASPLEERFRQLDVNGDGVLSGDELKSAPLLKRLDTDGDGQVTLVEATAALQRWKPDREASSSKPLMKTAAVFDKLDRNGDGLLSPDELRDENWFARLDTNGDGMVGRAEAIAVLGEEFSGQMPAATNQLETASKLAPLLEGPEILHAAEKGVGRRVDDLTLTTLEGKSVALEKLMGDKGLVVGLFTSTCPISRKLGPEMKRLEQDLPARGVALIWVNASASAPTEKVAAFAKDFDLTAPVLLDPTSALLTSLNAQTTTEAFVIDPAHTLVYRGAIHDQYGLGYSREQFSRHYVQEAVSALIAGNKPKVGATSAPGCALDLPSNETALTADGGSTTYHHQIARIMQNHCVECHRDGGIGPFALDTYDDVIEHVGMIRRQVERGVMPPWFASEDQSGIHAVFANDRSLPERDKADLLAWLNSDRPIGDAKDTPVAQVYPDAWEIGRPDLVLQIDKPIQVKAEGAMPYQNVVIETGLTEDRWVSAYEILPTARQVVHHVIINVHPKGERIKALGDGHGFWAAYVPGNSHRVFPPEWAKFLPAGSRMSFQIHYTPNGQVTEDQVRIGLQFAKSPPHFEVKVTALANPRIRIPPGAANHIETLERRIPADMTVTGFMPHLHTRGSAFSYELIRPDGSSEMLLDIPRYDFNWQLQYTLARPLSVSAGSRIKITAAYDNSPGNPANPDPSATVRWGPQTWDEMMIGYVEHVVPARAPGVAAK